jgi:hypothetical protein
MARMFRRATIGTLSILAALTIPTSALGATWARGRTTPSLRQVVAVDKTGETRWIYGQEDVAGDGLASFTPREQSIDIRTAYATTDPTTFWVRAYVSEENAAGSDMIVFAFIDADANPLTGGKASAPEIHPLLTTDPSAGGYEYVIGIRGNGTIEGLWEWRAGQTQYVVIPPGQGSRGAEAGRDLDPIRIGRRQHGYVQATVDLATIGLAPACGANLFFRSVNTAQGLGNGDLDVGQLGPCIPVDHNGDHVPDVIDPPAGCAHDDECPEDGVCQDGRCIVAAPCETSADCRADEQCTPDGRCVPQGGAPCTSNDQCNGLVCVNGTCGACTPGGTECGAEHRCAPDGRCVNGGGGDGDITIPADGRIVGGAFNCSTHGGTGGTELTLGALLAVGVGGAISRRRRAGKADQPRT